ncbi:NADPH-dependent FMN reductase [Rhizobium sullae]|uniref:NAD(P)H-dependent FMN reductase n=1 Tax=Rhizobium sullae TaxID=50338 RepID=A0A4R3Q5S0_RHISU|nr:NAD(P)H-dependent oxidoreductase [Rhizobium sullae]TCU16593.1 NAD(P)H-dependent FMN reductase [Rhizobium sullae]
MKTAIKVGVIYGSIRQGRICDRVVKWLSRQLVLYPLIDLDIIDPLDFDLPSQHDDGHREVKRLASRLNAVDAFIVVTPEYNHSFTAALKFVLDSFNEPWHGKPVAFVSYGGISGGLRAVEQLRLVFAELHAVTVRDTVSIAAPWNRFDEDGNLDRPEEALKLLARMMARLQWWAHALTAARAERPYRSIAA